MVYSLVMIDVTAYLNRIHYSGPLSPDAETLCGLHRAHLYSVPFENLNIHLGLPIRLEEEALFEKIVQQRRGGFCYELNGLFARLLEKLGYKIDLLNARGVNDDGSYAIEFDHLVLLVRCPGAHEPAWLADIGWGNGPLEPVRLEVEVEQVQGERVLKLVQSDEYTMLVEQVIREDGSRGWMRHYVFTLQPRAYADFFPACHYHTTSPQSIFTQKRLCTLFTEDGRVTLSERRLIITSQNEREERELLNEEEVREALRNYFDITL